MKVRLKDPRVGVIDGMARSYERGQTIEVPDAEGRKMIDAGQAEEAKSSVPERR